MSLPSHSLIELIIFALHVCRLPYLVINIIHRKTFAAPQHLIHCAWVESEVWQLFRAWKASEAITLPKKEKRKKSEKLSVFAFLSSPSFALRTGFTQEQFLTITFLPERRNGKKSAKLWTLWWMFWGAINSSVQSIFMQNGGKYISAVCDDDRLCWESFVRN